MGKRATYHDALRQIGFSQNDGPHAFQHLDENSIFRGRSKGASHITQSGVNPFDIELVFHCEWDAVERSPDLAGLLEFAIQCMGLGQCIFKNHFRNTVGLLMSCRG